MAFDPDFDKVSLLLHCDGAEGSSTFVDSSAAPKTVTAYGNAKISTAQSKFGGASALFDGASYLTAAHSTDLELADKDFCIEMWLRMSALPASGQYVALASKRVSAAMSNAFTLWYAGTEKFYFSYSVNGTTQIDSATLNSTNLIVGQFYHVALVRSAGVIKIYLDGVVGAGVHNIGTASIHGGGTEPLKIGATNSTPSYHLNGYIDELRITKGVARYTANFTPPTEPFPDTAPAPALSAYAAAPTPLGAPATLAASIRQAWGSAASPLGAPAILAASGETFFARAAAATPLGAPLALARAVGAARVATAGPLGAGAALGQLVAVARAAASSPLGVPVVRASVLLQAQGFNSTAFGTPSSATRLQAAGFRATRFGTPVSPIQAMPIMVGVSFGTPRSTIHTSVGGGGVPITVLARGWRNSRFGSPTALTNLQVQAHGWHGARFGQPVARQTLQAAAIAPATAFGTPAAQLQMRAQARGWQSSRFGTPLLRRQVNAEGFSATRFGTPTAKAMFRAQAHGFRASAFGTPAMAWVVRALPMSPSTRFGRPARTRSTEC